MAEATTRSKRRQGQGTALLFIHAQTGLHPGSGTALGAVDLTVQRERHTQWPVIPGSTLKGILRDECRRADGNNDDLFAAFGPDTTGADKHAGALSVTDARILAFPVRSLKGVFAWVTCPAVLERLNRDMNLARTSGAGFSLPAGPATDTALCQQNSPLLVDRNKLVLEEFEFDWAGDANTVVTWLSQRAVDDAATQKRLQSHLVVLHDDDFTHFVRHATEVVARVGLDYERKTVKTTGALFYEEFLPAETLFYALVLTSASRREGHGKGPAEIMDYLRGNLPSLLQIGGDETIGKGLCAVRLDSGKDGG